MRFAVDAHRVLKPHGRLLIHMLAPSGIWSRLPLIVRLQWRDARVMKRRRQFGKSISGRMVQHQVFPQQRFITNSSAGTSNSGVATAWASFGRNGSVVGFRFRSPISSAEPKPTSIVEYLLRLWEILVLEMERSGDPRIAWPLSGKPADRPRVGEGRFRRS